MKKILVLISLFMGCAICAQNRIPHVTESRSENKSIKEMGVWLGAEISGGVSVAHSAVISSTYPVSTQVYVGYRFSDMLKIGVGAGFRYYFKNSSSRYYVDNKNEYENYGWAFPLVFNARGLMMPGRSRNIVPCWSADIGYSINDGILLSPSLGLSLGPMERNHFIVAVGYSAQKTELLSANNSGHRKGFLNILQLKLGYEF